mgnify:CR=1 FL=1
MNVEAAGLARQMWEHSRARDTVSLGEWMTLAPWWEFTPITVAGRVVGATMVCGHEIHLASWERPKASTRSCARNILRAVIERKGYATTTVLADNPAGLAFCRRLGFVVDNEENGVIRLTCKEPRHA